jgi:hypothetical protein
MIKTFKIIMLYHIDNEFGGRSTYSLYCSETSEVYLRRSFHTIHFSADYQTEVSTFILSTTLQSLTRNRYLDA